MRAKRGTLPKSKNGTPSPVSQSGSSGIFPGDLDEKYNAEDPLAMTTTTASGVGESIFTWEARALTIPIEEQAPCFFISNFVRLPRESGSRGSFDFLLPIIKTEKTDSHLAIAFQAVALASLANRPSARSSGLMVRAIGHYSKALKGLNLALQNPAQQKSDATLASIILMGFFEVGGLLFLSETRLIGIDDYLGKNECYGLGVAY
jgi:hypothetical protein